MQRSWFFKNLTRRHKNLFNLLWEGVFNQRSPALLKPIIYELMKEIIQTHKKIIKTVKDQMGLSDYGMYWLAFIEGGLTIWILERIFFHWLKF